MELAFTYAHRALHSSLPTIHLLHHVCRHCSFTTNLLFHPLDLAIEFGGPIAVCIASHVCLFHDTPALFGSICVMTAWYAMDHDEWARLPHWSHHKAIDSVYTAYVKQRDYSAGFDRVRGLVDAGEASQRPR